MSDTLREDILQSKAGQRMIETVSPIYDNSYVGLWMYEAMGREWDALLDVIESLKTELSPESATWMLELWERRYGITPPSGSTIEQRRQAIIRMRALPSPMSPYRLENYLEAVTGRKVQVIENIDDYTFGIIITGGDDEAPMNMELLRKEIRRHKPSHMAYDLTLQAETRIQIKAETAYWRFFYSFCGTLPETNMESGLADRTIEIIPVPGGFIFRYHRAGMEDAGTVPDENTIGGVESRGITATANADGYHIEYPPCGVYNSGGDIL